MESIVHYTSLADQARLLALFEEAYPADWPDRLARVPPVWECIVVGSPD